LANSYFQFKQFRIEQGNCAMKVSTDACILGAYTPIKNAKNIIDIGAGTGLLSLMLAQKSAENVRITAIEIDEIAAQQAIENIKNSKWATKIEVINTAIQTYSQTYFQGENLYDLAICNPPFFVNSTLPPNQKQAIAHHTTALSFEDLWQSVEKLLHKNGYFVVLLPVQETEIFSKIANLHNFVAMQQLMIQDSPKHNPHRIITIYTKKDNFDFMIKESLLIKEIEGNYSQDFISLLKDYYLYL
jgi:tRNA1Val (adenine37-N6)-methyltransferase